MERVRTLLEAARHAKHLTLRTSNFPAFDLEGHRKKLAKVIANALEPKTLELNFGCLRTETSDHVMDLDQPLTNRTHWPILQRLALKGFRTTERVLQKFLGSHATSLKFLRMDHKEFALIGDSVETHAFGGLFFSLIRYLQNSLKISTSNLTDISPATGTKARP